MKDFINRILEIDRRAKQLSLDPEDMKSKADAELKEEINQIQQNMTERTKKSVSEYEDAQKKSALAKLERQKKNYKQILVNFDELYKQNKKSWVDTIVNSVTK